MSIFSKITSIFKGKHKPEETTNNNVATPHVFDLDFPTFEFYFTGDTLPEYSDQISDAQLAKFEKFLAFLEGNSKLDFSKLKATLLEPRPLTTREYYNQITTLVEQYRNFELREREANLQQQNIHNNFTNHVTFLELTNLVSRINPELQLFNPVNGSISPEAATIISKLLYPLYIKYKNFGYNLPEFFDGHDVLDLSAETINLSDKTQTRLKEFLGSSYKHIYQAQKQELQKDIEVILSASKPLDYLDTRLPFLSLVLIARKLTALPLSYHELLNYFFLESPDHSFTRKEKEQFVELRKLLLSLGDNFYSLIISEYLTFKCSEHNLTAFGSYRQQTARIAALHADLAQETSKLFALIFLLRRKINTSEISFFSKDLNLVEFNAFCFDDTTNFVDLYLFYKWFYKVRTAKQS